ncbi:hypothetical protein FB45DRAFT_868585 [Roridomyces roridus]|uniref:Uncharacterized protein n=1 Tax=Roridomyces roridus TaxID=1738132 RepID=A0AAD7BQ71_9AGAR|nr:hypothetical protein FB45DRAFT_868585 [Roridomyces roridus]
MSLIPFRGADSLEYKLYLPACVVDNELQAQERQLVPREAQVQRERTWPTSSNVHIQAAKRSGATSAGGQSTVLRSNQASNRPPQARMGTALPTIHKVAPNINIESAVFKERELQQHALSVQKTEQDISEWRREQEAAERAAKIAAELQKMLDAGRPRIDLYEEIIALREQNSALEKKLMRYKARVQDQRAQIKRLNAENAALVDGETKKERRRRYTVPSRGY